LDGEVLIRAPGETTGTRLVRGDYFGDEYVSDLSQPFQHTVENPTEKPCKLALLSNDAVTSILETDGEVEETLSEMQKMAMLRKVYVFRHLSDHQCKLIAKSFRTIKKKKGGSVVKQGEIGSQFFVIKKGELLVTIEGRGAVRTLGKSDYFGERGLLYNELRTATVLCQSSDAELLVIDKDVFLQILEGKMLQHLEERMNMQNRDVSLSDVREVRVLGHGTYGVVKLVEHKSTNTKYALKCISRAQAVKNRQQEALALEREILLENDHPFIVKVVRTCKDRRYLYFFTEVAIGGELYDAIRQIGLLTRTQAQFYTGSLVLALESLHERNIAYRDLKPENVMLDSQGYIKLIDFGCALKLRGITFSLVGTPHYMAPEVILGKGYGTSCDIWSLGVCLYEFMVGPLPFASDSEDTIEIFCEILTGNLRYPSATTERLDKPSKEILRQLLLRPIESRLGCGADSWNHVRKHKFFMSFCWDTLLSRGLDPPLVPKEREDSADDNSKKELAQKISGELAEEMDIEPDGWDKDF